MMSSEEYPGSPPPPPMGAPSGLFGLGRPQAHQLSPYLNVNPSYVQTPEFIVNQETKKGRIERSFSGIGASVLVGAAVGGTYGLFDGVRWTAMKGMKGGLRRTQILNYTMKSGASVSNSLGSIAVIYSGLHALASQFREEDDELKCLATAGLTGALYRSSAGAVKCGTGAAFGLGLGAVWSFLLKSNENVSYYV